MSGVDVETPAEEQVTEPRAPWSGWDPLLRAAGVLISVLAALISGLLEIIVSTFRAGDVVSVWSGDPIGSGGGPLIWLSVVLAAVLNYAIAGFAVATTGRRWAVGPAWAAWTMLMLFAASVRTAERDYLLNDDNLVALLTVLVGSLSFAVYAYRMILKGGRR